MSPRGRAIVLALLALSAGCSGKAPRTGPVPAVAQVDSLMKRHHATFASGDLDAWGRLFAPDAFMIAADPDQAIAGRDSIVAVLHRDFDPSFQLGLTLTLRSLDPWIGFAPDSQSAWVSDVVAYGAEIGGEHSDFVVAWSAVVAPGPDGWAIQAAHYSRPLARASAESLATARSLPMPRDLGEGVASGAEPLLAWLRSSLADSVNWLGPVESIPGTNMIGAEPGERAVGATETRALLDRERAEEGHLHERPGGARAALLSGGTLAWVAMNLERRASVRGRNAVVPYRALLVYRKQPDSWALVQAHLSNGQEDPE